MGSLVEIGSSDLLLPRPRFSEALAALRALAKRRPDDFLEPDAVVEALDIEEALANADFAYETNAEGDIVALRYRGDKAPPGTDELWFDAFCRAIAPFVQTGSMTIAYDDAPGEVYRFANEKVSVAKAKKKPKAKAKVKPATKPRAKAAVAETFSPLPEGSAGIRWAVELHFRDGSGWQRKRPRVEKALRAIAETRWWGELDSFLQQDQPAPLAVAAKGEPLDVDDVVPKVANGQTTLCAFVRRDGEVSVDFRVSTFELQIALHARDGALERLGDAAYAGAAELVARLVAELGDDAWVTGAAVVTRARPIDREEASRTALPIRWPAEAWAIVVDGSIPENKPKELRDETRALAAEGAAAPAVVHQAGEVTIVRWPVVPGDPASVRGATQAYDAWLGDRVARLPWQLPVGAAPAATTPNRAKKPEIDVIWLRSELTFHDRPMWFADPGRARFVVERLARTVLWREVASDGALDETIDECTRGRGVTVLKSKSKDVVVRIERAFATLGILADVKPGALARVGASLVDEFVALVRDLRFAFRGRATMAHAELRPYGTGFDGEKLSQQLDSNDWPANDAVAMVLDLEPTQDARWFTRVAGTRAFARAAVPPEARRVERDGLVVVTFTDDLSDTVRTADATRASSQWHAWASRSTVAGRA